jgi:hypothetical protein
MRQQYNSGMGKQGGNGVDARLDKIDERLSGLDTRIGSVEREVHGLNKTLKAVGGGLALLLALLVGIIAFAGKSVIRDIARDVYREEFAFRATVSQDGKLSQANMLIGDGIKTGTLITRQFRWDLREPISPDKLISIRVQLRNSLPGVSATAELTEGGKACVMTIKGDAEQIEPAMPIDATVVIETRA